MDMKNTVPSAYAKYAQAQESSESALLELPNVVGVSLSTKMTGDHDTKKKCISVLVSSKMNPDDLGVDHVIPEKIGKFRTDVVEIGDVFAGDADPMCDPDVDADMTDETTLETFAPLASSPMLRKRVRPVMGGFSVGHPRVSAGTIATCCYDRFPYPSMPRSYYILSNNHILANSNNARVGDPILQPGRADGGRFPRDVVAKLARFVPIRFRSGTSMPTNYVDAAIAEGDLETLSREIFWIGYVKANYSNPTVGDVLQKTGRTTGYTTGRVTNINATIDVNYGGGRIARFRRQIVTSRMGVGGDSGSLMLNDDNAAVGLLFAGSTTRTIANNMAYVEAFLSIRLK